MKRQTTTFALLCLPGALLAEPNRDEALKLAETLISANRQVE